jgi:hypothetical protein
VGSGCGVTRPTAPLTRRPGRRLPQQPVVEPELPVSRPATSLGWAPPFTDTPDEITRRRTALLAEVRRTDTGRTHHTSRRTWDAAIREALTDLTDTTEREEAS